MCTVNSQSTNSTSNTCNHTFDITSSITCSTPWVIYNETYSKEADLCAELSDPQYEGFTERAVKVRFSEDVGSVTQPYQANTSKPVGVHFRYVGHNNEDMVSY